MEDLSVQGLTVKDESRYDRNTSGAIKERVYRFYLGPKHGPFEERVSLANFDPNEINTRIAAIRAQVQAIIK